MSRWFVDWSLLNALESVLAVLVGLRGPDVNMIECFYSALDLNSATHQNGGVLPGTRLPHFNTYSTLAFDHSSRSYAL